VTRPLDGDGIGGPAYDMGAYEFVPVSLPGAVAETFGGPHPPLLVSTGNLGVTLTLSWGASCGNAADYGIYEGILGVWYSHASIACSTGGVQTADIAPGSGNRYYFVVPLTATQEGGYGHSSSGLPIPVGSAACRPVQNLAACP